MYIPKLNQMTDRLEILDFLRRFSFGIISSLHEGKIVATHLPFIIEERGDKLIIKSHFAKANPQARTLHNPLVIFSEPHAYISPKNYEKELNVPTWNYLAVHIYGDVTFIKEPKDVHDLLIQTICTFEEGFKAQYDRLPQDYKVNLAKGIIAFEIEVTEIEAKKKLSQNKTEQEKHNVIASLSKSPYSTERDIAEYMQKDLDL